MNRIGRHALRTVVWSLTPALLAATWLVGRLDPGAAGTTVADLAQGAPFLIALAACYGVGVAVTVRAPSHGAGWSFVGLATSLAWSALTDSYARLAMAPAGDALPGAELAATFGDTSFMAWFVFLALVLQCTPGARESVAHGRWLPVVTVACALVFQVAALLRGTHLDAPYGDLSSPWAVAGVAGPARVTSTVAILLLGACLLASVVAMVLAFRRATGETRRQLLWLATGAAPLAPGIVVAFVASYLDEEWLASVVLTTCVVTLAVGVGLSVVRYRLYDVERIVTDSTAYAFASGAVVAAFGLVVLVITRTVPGAQSGQVSTVLATLAGAAVARPAYVWVRNGVDRRFDRRRHDAVQVLERGLARPSPDVEALIRQALEDPGTMLYFRSESGWVTAQGRPAALPARHLEVIRNGRLTAALSYDVDRAERATVDEVVTRAAAEIDNLALRAELARQVEQVTESRTRLAQAHLEERRRVERDLHDGAQQSLLAIALRLQSAKVNGSESALRGEVDHAVESLASTVQELRTLTNGLQSAALAGGGLRAATEELADRIPVRLRLDVLERRFEPTVESAAWFVVAEGVANAVKHARVDELDISARERDGHLHVVVSDAGVGGVDEGGHGLQGLADRVAALGGRFSADTRAGGGTRLEAVFPCA